MIRFNQFLGGEKMKKIFFLGIFLAIILLGCQNGDSDDDTYAVWTDVSSYSEYETSFNDTLYDGYYKYLEFSNEQFSQMKSALENEQEGRHEWTENQIKKYFVGRGFDSETAAECAAWLVTANHGFLASRSGNFVYYILK